MTETLCYAVVFLFEALIAWLYFDRVFPEKRASQKKITISFTLGYIVLFLLARMENVVINGAASVLINTLLLFICYRTKFVPGLLHVGYMSIMMFGTELLVALVLSKFTADFSAYLYELE